MCKLHKHIPNLFDLLLEHSKFKFAIQLLFGILLSFSGAVLLGHIQYFVNHYIAGKESGWLCYLESRIWGIIGIAVVLGFSLYIFLTISKKEDIANRKEIIDRLDQIDN